MGRLGFMLALCAGLTATATAGADERTLRIATIVPEGTAWARELRAFAREIETATHDSVKVKLYLGGIAGDELEMTRRLERGQLDGIGSGGMVCENAAPSLRVLRLMGLFQTRGEVSYVLNQLQPRLDREFAAAGFINLGESPLGATLIFSRQPITTLDELKHTRLWRWKPDEIGAALSERIGFAELRTEIGDAAPAYDDGRIDGFYVIPTAALAWQLSARVRYLTALPMDYLVACLVLSQRAFGRLDFAQQQALRSAAAKISVRLNDVNAQQDDALLHGAFARQGLKIIEPSAAFRSAFFAAARAARDALGEKFVSRELLGQVMTMLADYRAEHRAAESP